MRNVIPSIFLLLFLFFSQTASAVTYSWRVTYDPTHIYNASTPLASFELYYAAFYPGWPYEITSTTWDSPTKVTFRWRNRRPTDPVGVWANSNKTTSSSRFGDSCLPGAVYNPVTGGCDATPDDPCLPKAGQHVEHEFAFRNLNSDGDPDTDPPLGICFEGCQYSHTFGPFVNAGRDGKRPDLLLGKFDYMGNGMSCTGGTGGSNFDQPPSKAPMNPAPIKITDDKCSTWATGADGVSRRTCTGSDYYNDPGLLKCDTAGGTMTCSVSKPAPYSSDKQTIEDQTKATNVDGSSSAQTTTTTTTTTCKGLNKCTSTTKTETTSTGTNADGTPGDSSETCQGTACTATPDDAQEEGEEQSQEEGESPSVVGIVKPSETGTFDDAISDWEEQIADSKDEIREKVTQIGGAFSGSVNLGGAGGSLYCGPSVVVLGQAINFCLNDYSSQLGLISAFMLFMGALIALYIVFK